MIRTLFLIACWSLLATATQAAAAGHELIDQGRQAFASKDVRKLQTLAASARAMQYPLAHWIDYWATSAGLKEATQAQVDAFYARHRGTYVEDRLRNDWLLELGKRRDWAGVQLEKPRFKMNDDREVNCYAVLADSTPERAKREAALAAWMAQRDGDDGCALLGQTMAGAGVFSQADIWAKVRQAVEQNRNRVGREAAALINETSGQLVTQALDSPRRALAARDRLPEQGAVYAIAAAKLAASDAPAAATALRAAGKAIAAPWRAWAWAQVAKQAAIELDSDALDHARRAWAAAGETPPDWSDDTLAWQVRLALRLASGDERWKMVEHAIDHMSAEGRQDAAWRYWQARAWMALAPEGRPGDAQRERARTQWQALASEYGYYGQLAAEELGATQALPPDAPALSAEERSAAGRHAGLQRALTAFALDARSEGVREWNFSLMGMNPRELRAAAALACEKEVWDRCINTSERSSEVDFAQRFPMPMKADVLKAARAVDLDPAYVYGLIRQESRFIVSIRSGAGAAGLMQVMPATARWTARRIGMTLPAGGLHDKQSNLKLGCAYLKLALDDMEDHEALAAAAYNAGPNRPRRWREGPVLETAIWIENIPFGETRDYVRKVLSNTAYYAGVISGKTTSIKSRLGSNIGPRASDAPMAVADLP